MTGRTDSTESAYKAYEQDSLDPTPGSPFFHDHVSRYWWASELARGKQVLDCACGKGYGSYILAKRAREVLGIDLNPRSLEIAREIFAAPNLTFEGVDVLTLSKLGRRFDLVTAFEVIEHIPSEQTDSFLKGLKAVLAPGGTLLLSTPNHDVVLKSGVHVPEFHINNFRASELRRLLEKQFGSVEMLGQYRRRGRIGQWIFDLDSLNLRHRLGKILRGRGAASSPTVGKENRTVFSRAHFEEPDPGVADYRFSPAHWRQAGLTLAVCREPK